MKYSILLVGCIFIALLPTSTFATQNLFIEIGKQDIVVGEYQKDSYEQIIIGSYPRTAYPIEEIKNSLIKENEKVLFYIHSMWGGNTWYHKSSLEHLNELEGVDRIVSIIWHTDHIGYKASWTKAILQGEMLAPLMEALVGQRDNQNYLLCHSMGHRLMEGMAKELTASCMQFESVFLMAADLDIDVFEDHLQHFPNQTEELIIYVNEKDKWLKPSKWIHGKERLGLNAGTRCSNFERFPQIQIVDVSEIKTSGWTTQKSHIYFKNNLLVLEDLNRSIADKPNELDLTSWKDCANYRALK